MAQLREFDTMWYRAAIKGEYWLTDNGPVYADGDLADDNHEMLAESHMLGELGNDIEDDGWGTQTFYNARNMFLEALQNPGTYLGQMEEYVEAMQAEYGDDWWDYADYEGYLIWLNTNHIEDETERRIKKEWVDREMGGMKDPRTHVSKYYDWVRVQGKNIEVWELNDLTRIRIRRQIEQIYDEEGLGDEDETWKESPIFNLSVLSTGQYVPSLSFYDLVTQGEEKKKAKENAYDFFPDYRTTKKFPTNIPGYQYQGG